MDGQSRENEDRQAKDDVPDQLEEPVVCQTEVRSIDKAEGQSRLTEDLVLGSAAGLESTRRRGRKNPALKSRQYMSNY